MGDPVRAIWLTFTELFEGGVGCLYNDVRGIPTIAFGNAVFTASEAAALPLMHPGGVPATTAEKVAAWNTVKNDPKAAKLGWTYAAKLTTIRLTREGMGALALAKYDSNDRILRARCPDWDDMPACARMALHSLAWACGANAHFPRLFTAVNARDFDRAAIEIHINEWTPEGTHNAGLVPRNLANETLMLNAARVQAFHLDPSYLNWTSLVGVPEAATLPDLSASVEEYDHTPTSYVDIIEGRPIRPGPPDDAA